MDIIDFHVHVYPEKIADRATDSTCNFYNLKTKQSGTIDGLLKKGAQAGIIKYVLLPVATNPAQVRSVNNFTISEVNKHKEFYGFGTLHAAQENIMEELEFIENSGLKGVKLHPDIQQFPMDDERLYPVYDYLQGRFPILIHCGDKRYDYSHPARLKKLLKDFPRLNVIAAHLGGWSIFEEGFSLLKDEKVMFDTSSCMEFLTGKKIKQYILNYGTDRILFGTDYPLWEPENVVRSFFSLGLSTEDEEKILYKNAYRILEENSFL